MRVSAYLLFTVFCLGCMHEKTAPAEEMTSADATPPAAGANAQPQKLIKKANYRFQVEDIARSVKNIEGFVAGLPAYLADSRLSTTSGRVEHVLVIRVQAPYFDELLSAIDTQPLYTDYRNVIATDHSKEFVDLEARLKTKREVLDRYTSILRNKTGTIEEILSAERQIGHLQEEIESAVSRLNFINDQVAHSTVTLEMYQYLHHETSVPETPLGKEFAEAFQAGLDGTARFLIILTHLWPALVVGLTGWLIAYYRRRRRPVA